jgi:hypothetical protein
VRAGIFKSVDELETAIADYLRHHNTKPEPFIWIAKAADILVSAFVRISSANLSRSSSRGTDRSSDSTCS